MPTQIREDDAMMFGKLSRRTACAILALGLAALIATNRNAIAQNLSTGALNVTVHDPAGAVVNGASLVLTNLETNDAHKAVTAGAGTAAIPYLNPSRYSLSVSMTGFKTKVYSSVTIQTNQVTDIDVTLELGTSAQTVTVSGNATPLLNTTDNTIATTVDLSEVQDLPVFARDAFPLAFLVPGAVGNNFDNLPGGAVDVSANGFSTMVNRNKSAGFDDDGPSITNRLEDVQEMTVQTSQLDASHGGTSTMNIEFLTKSGTNKFHGQFFEDYRNDALNANTWYNNALNPRLPRPKLIINDFGGSVGGPIIRNKAFFFVSLANYRQPSKFTVTSPIGTAQALSGIYSYIPTGSSSVQTDNVLQAGASAGCSTCTATVNPIIAQDLSNIESTYTLPGVVFSPLDLNHENLNFLNKAYTVEKFPTLRLDYDLTRNFRIIGSVNESNFYDLNGGAPPFPGPLFSVQADSSKFRNYQAVGGFDWNIKPNLVNAFRAGYLYTYAGFDSQGINTPTPAMVQQGQLAFGFGLDSGINYFAALKVGYLYPVLGFKDSATWQKGRHTIQIGAETSTELDHYYNGQFVPYIGVNYIASGDPVTSALTNSLPANAPASAVGDVEGLYATLNGRMTYYSLGQFVNAQTKQFQPGIAFDLHERLNQTAVFFEDAWRATPTLTFNYGLRWDFTGASRDETGFYTHPTIPDMWGPTPVGALFQPGNLGGVQNPVEGPSPEAYAPTYVHPEPNVGVAWNPHDTGSSWFDRFTGNGKTVFRVAYSFKNYTEGAQNFWNFGSNFGANFNTYFTAFPVAPSGGTPGRGFYNAGSLILGNSLPALGSTSPVPFNPIISEASQGFTGTSYFTFDPHIQQPWVESWTVGVERQLSPNNVLEMRYVGNVSRKQWLGVNYNELNIFENGFLSNFKAAQSNLAASGNTTFQGSNPTPLFDQAFAATGAAGNYTNGQFITYLQQGQAGAFANALASNPSYLCSMINAASFVPCVNAGASGSGTYPINVFQANPYAAGAAIDEMTNNGYSNYNALQVDFRQHMNHGMQFDVNYTLAHSLDNNVQGSTSPGAYGGGGNSNSGNSAPGYYTLRDTHLNYFPSAFDIRHVVHASGIYQLPFGHNQPFFSQNSIANAVIGGWTLGTIIDWQSGDPHLFFGGTQPFNTSDGGLTLTGVTESQLQSQIRIRPGPTGSPWKTLFNPKYYNSSGQANTSYISPNFNAGTIGTLLWLHDPKWINTDMSVTKLIPIHEQLNFTLQSEFFNVFNHPAWAGMDTGVQDYTFGTTNATANGPRNIELRGNFQF
jgi:hypothetical protein